MGVTARFSIAVDSGAVGLVVDGVRRSARPIEAYVRIHPFEDSFNWWFERNGIYGVGWILVPIWTIGVAAAIPTAWLWWSDRRARGSGFCQACGYDLGGLRAGAVCPECGAARETEPRIRAG